MRDAGPSRPSSHCFQSFHSLFPAGGLRTADAPLNLCSDSQLLCGFANTKAFAKCHYQSNLFSRLFVMDCFPGATTLPEGGELSVANYTHHVVASLHNKVVGFASAHPTDYYPARISTWFAD
jgi:hypothetical protein